MQHTKSLRRYPRATYPNAKLHCKQPRATYPNAKPRPKQTRATYPGRPQTTACNIPRQQAAPQTKECSIPGGDQREPPKNPAFFESGRGVRGEGENFFSREKKFSPFPRLKKHPTSNLNLTSHSFGTCSEGDVDGWGELAGGVEVWVLLVVEEDMGAEGFEDASFIHSSEEVCFVGGDVP